jgi:hypothetical protein
MYKRIVITFIFMIILSSADSVQAQWKRVDARNDNAGHLIYFEEKNNRGDVRITRWSYFPGTHIVSSEIITTVKIDGSKTRSVERRDRLNRVISIYNGFKNGAGVLVRGVRQRWSYRDANDTRGNQIREEYNPNKREWERLDLLQKSVTDATSSSKGK